MIVILLPKRIIHYQSLSKICDLTTSLLTILDYNHLSTSYIIKHPILESYIFWQICCLIHTEAHIHIICIHIFMYIYIYTYIYVYVNVYILSDICDKQQ
jgi:hypothetical protein